MLESPPASFAQALALHLDNYNGLDFTRSTGDPCVFHRINDAKQQLIRCYCDDLTLCLQDPTQLDDLLAGLRRRFLIDESEGQPVDWLLGQHIHQDLEKGVITIDQEQAITKLAKAILTKEELDRCREVKTPMAYSVVLPRLAADSPDRVTDKRKFHMLSVCGGLLHISGFTRVDVATAVGILCRHAVSYGSAHAKLPEES